MAEKSVDEINQEKALKRLMYTYNMYENTKYETEKRMRDALDKNGKKKYTEDDIQSELALLVEAQNDIVGQYLQCGGKEEDLVSMSKKKKSGVIKKDNEVNTVLMDMMKNMDSDRKDVLKKMESEQSDTITRLEQEYIPQKGNYNPEAAFDVIPLPSKGEGYKDKIAKMSVAYLTAYDENMIVSPNLYRDNLIIDYILQEKVLSKEIDPLDLLEGDREAIILFLRASGYGNEYPITATDEKTGKEFETIVDLSKLKYKDFNLKGDSNGWFKFELPVSKKEVKFRFPTHRDNVILEKLQKAEDAKMTKESIDNCVGILDELIETDTNNISGDEKANIRRAIRTIEKWGESIDDENSQKFNHTLTNRLNLLVMAVDGITDRKYISDFIMKMNVRDSSALRKYIQKNEPGVDYNITVERPESLGGGSFTTFLQLDQFLFLNIAD